MAHQILNPSFQQRMLSNSKFTSKHNPSSTTRCSSRASSVSTQMSSLNDDVAVSEEIKNNAPTSRGHLEFEFVNGDFNSEEEVTEKKVKRPLSLGDIQVDNGNRNLIEQIYQVERRHNQPQKRLKPVKDTEEILMTQNSRFEISGRSGLGDYMKQDPRHSEVSTPDIVDLTLGKHCECRNFSIQVCTC